MMPLPLRRFRRFLGRIAAHRSGVAMIEFALGLPILLTAGLWGVETVNLSVAQLKVGQLAIQLADNGSRIGDTSTLEDRKIYESDINDLLLGGNIQAGRQLDFFTNGRVVISSLQVDDATGNQYIAWQRCKGMKQFVSAYGTEGDGLQGGLAGMGPAGAEITAEPGEAVIYVEVSYDYQPLISGYFSPATELRSTAAFNVRDSRDLSQIYQRDTGSPDPVSDCGTYSDFS